MPIHPEWSDLDLTVRPLCSSLAGLVIGFDRGEHGRPARLRTTMLVCLAACLSMIQAKLLLSAAGKTSDSFVVLVTSPGISVPVGKRLKDRKGPENAEENIHA
jgi:putative Mg2+ transporter-C (MgtC) family protein